MNVAFTRARSKLIIIGSRTTLMGTPLLASFFDLMQERDWILQLPPDAHRLHDSVLPNAASKKRNRSEDAGGSIKKMRTCAGEEGILKGRPLLTDIFANDS